MSKLANDVLRHNLDIVQEVLTEAILKAAEGLMRVRDVDARVAELDDRKQ
jgi:hypothetical protein